MKIDVLFRASQHERYASTAFDSQVGKEIPVNVGDVRRTGVVRAVKVAEDGLSATLTVEVATPLPDLEALVADRPMSFGFRAPRSDEVICKICGHGSDDHRFAQPVFCGECPDRVCQNGEAGERYRTRLSQS